VRERALRPGNLGASLGRGPRNDPRRGHRLRTLLSLNREPDPQQEMGAFGCCLSVECARRHRLRRFRDAPLRERALPRGTREAPCRPVSATNRGPSKESQRPCATRTLRERVEDMTEALYEDIERGLREALTNATKARKTRCPACHEAFEVRLPDHAASISPAKSILDLIVSRPKPELEPSLVASSAFSTLGHELVTSAPSPQATRGE